MGEGVVGAAGDRGSVLGHGEIGKVRRSALTLQQLREKAALLHLLLPCVEGLPQGVGGGAAGVRLAAGAADQLPCQQGRNGGEGVHEPAVQRTVLRAPGQQAAEGILLRRQRVALILTGRQAVVEPRQHLTLLGHLEVHPAQAVHDAALPIHQNEVGVAGHGLQDQAVVALLPQLVHRPDGQCHPTLQRLLLQTQQPSPGQMLPQQHTEHGGLGGVVPQLLGQMQPGLAGSGVEQQAPPAPQQQDHLIPCRLLDLLNAGILYLGGGLTDHGLHTNGVQRHIIPPPSSRRTAAPPGRGGR